MKVFCEDTAHTGDTMVIWFRLVSLAKWWTDSSAVCTRSVDSSIFVSIVSALVRLTECTADVKQYTRTEYAVKNTLRSGKITGRLSIYNVTSYGISNLHDQHIVKFHLFRTDLACAVPDMIEYTHRRGENCRQVCNRAH